MTPIVAVFMSMISLLALVADRASLQEQGDSIPLPSVDDGVSRNFLDVAKRTIPLKMTPARSINLRRLPRAVGGSHPVPDDTDDVLEDSVPMDLARNEGAILLQSLIIRALSKRDIRDQLWGGRSGTGPSSSTKKPRTPHPSGRPRPTLRGNPHRTNSLGELRDDLMVHGRDREQLRRRWKIENAGKRVANVHG